MYILGLSCFYHDAAAVLLKDGQLIAAAEEERFSRQKHDFGFPTQAIQFCLQTAQIQEKDLDYIVFYEKPFLKFERILMTIFQTFPASARVFTEAMKTWLLNKLWIKSIIRERLNVSEDKILFCEHHLSHAASAFFCSGFTEAALLTVDGVGEWATTTWGQGRDNKIELQQEIRFPHSLGLLYSVFTAFLGFEVNEGEYKVMGMAPYGQPRYVDKVLKLINFQADGSFSLNMEYFSYHYSWQRAFHHRFESLFGKPRDPKLFFFTRHSGYPSYFGPKPANYQDLCEQNQYYADVAASIQKVTEEALLKIVNHLYEQTGLNKLCLAGGVGLNSKANGRIQRETPFKDIYIQPAAGDNGGALGAALYLWNHVLDQPKSFILQHAYWGKAYSETEIQQFLEEQNIPYDYYPDEEEFLSWIAKEISQGKVIGWFQGRFEWGPRALGNRSILADPRKPEMKDIVNTKIKFREPYRPFAPSVLVEQVDEYFDLPLASQHYPAKFMLYVVNVKEDKRSQVPAITHVDGSARIQTVFRSDNPRYYRLIQKFADLTGVPVLLNTSFNLKGEPIVNTPQNAFNTFIRSGIDILVLERYLIQRQNLSSSVFPMESGPLANAPQAGQPRVL